MTQCVCTKCPSWIQCGEKGGYCVDVVGKSKCIAKEKGCMCKRCPISKHYNLKKSSYCTRGSERTQLRISAIRSSEGAEDQPDYTKAIPLGEGVYWVGYNFEDLFFHTNAYLIVDGDEAVIIDPGSMVDYEKVRAKILSICPIENVKHIVLQHQDPDLCGSTVEFEKNADLDVYMAERSSVFSKFYGIKSFVNLIYADGQELAFKSGRKLRFYLTPYCHSPGAMITYDEKSGILFTSDIYGAFSKNWELYADMIGYKKHLDTVKKFMEPYMASKEAVMNALSKMEPLDIRMICPQHGSIIRRDVAKWLGELRRMRYGTAIGEKKTGLEINIFEK